MIDAFLLPRPPLTNSLPQLFLWAFRWPALGCGLSQAHRYNFTPQFHDSSQRLNFIDCRLHRYCLKPPKVTFNNALQSNLLQRRSEGSHGDPSHVFSMIFKRITMQSDISKTLSE
ncbi:hypothetical protein AVEN_161547-1 [Araneus ventricosus]|uniref:Uncharacterized protein n=1 Tax=Araneus ventricosus TaxID=182803 RepID=A0A4Y2QGT8_ARAVE|nr:hypothetical protein AVEN_161547-1 [Araneus ventricosus]